MENLLIAYSMKFALASAILYGLYALLFKTDTFLKIKRGYLLFALFFSLTFPFIQIEIPQEVASGITSILLPEYVITTDSQQADAKKPIELLSILLLASLSVSYILLMRMGFQLTQIINLRRKGKVEYINNTKVIRLDKNDFTPFSFFGWIFISNHNHKLKEILTHEQVHSTQWHSVDIMLSEIFSILFWWNPFVWLIKREIKINLEFLADKGVLEDGFDTKQYQYSLLQSFKSNTGISIINNFNVSQLKKRIMMMNKKKTSRLQSAKYGLIVPIVAALLFSNNAVSQDKKGEDGRSKMENVAISVSDAKENAKNSKKEGLAMVNIKISDTTPEENQKSKEAVKTNDEKPFTVVEQIPEFPGGQQDMYKFIGENLKYPINAQKAGIQGKVFVRFVITKTGEVTGATVIRSATESNNLREVTIVAKGTEKEESINTAEAAKELDAEAIRVISLMPKWVPGKQNGKEVDVYYTLPILFKLKK